LTNLPKKDRKINISVFTNTLFSGGAEKQALLLAKALSEYYNVWLVVYYGEQVEKKFLEIIRKEGIAVIFLTGSHFSKMIYLFRFLRKQSIDILFSFLLTTNFVGGLLGKAACIRYTVGGIRNSELARNKIAIQRLLQNYVNNVTVYNNFCGVQVMASLGFNREKAFVIQNCVELPRNLIIRRDQDIINILSVGRFHLQKDYYTAIKSMAELRKHFSQFNYTIVGYGKLEKKLRRWIKEFHLKDHVEVVINPENVPEYFEKADIYLMTSIFEGLSNTVLEAMSYSLPLVITDVGDNSLLVENGKNGFLCTPGNSGQIAGFLHELCNDYEKRIEFGKRSYEIAKTQFSFQAFQKKYKEFVEELACHKKRK